MVFILRIGSIIFRIYREIFYTHILQAPVITGDALDEAFRIILTERHG